MTDEEIIVLYRNGQKEKAFNEIVAAYSERLYWHVRGFVCTHDDTDDLLQEIFIKIWSALPAFRGGFETFHVDLPDRHKRDAELAPQAEGTLDA